jgi:Ni2+-binding GTPase involved in maturation of urease and hydrogenase
MKKLRFILIGGFLGAGKTTTLGRLARHFVDRGQRVGLLTNDQAQELVDTTSLRAQGFDVEEVAGACFCCRFDDLVRRVAELEEGRRPDVILAEPVGSCTDLVATVLEPLSDLYRDRFEIAPYAVLFKPSHGLPILRQDSDEGFSPKAAYIFKKQLEEADAIVINRLDELTSAHLSELEKLVAAAYPATPVLAVSARTGLKFDGLIRFLEQSGPFGRKILNINYDTYAEGEAELGWLNATARVTGDRPVDLDLLLIQMVAWLHVSLVSRGAEVAHLKILGLADGSFGVANAVSSKAEPELSVASRAHVTDAELTINARVAVDPVLLEDQVRQTLTAVGEKFGISAEFRSIQSFRPGRPQPTHRYRQAVRE